MTKPTKRTKGKATPKANTSTKRDQFGLRAGTKTAKAAGMFAKGATMAQVQKATGSAQYNILRWLEDQGHKVSRKDGFITVVPKAS